MTEERIPTWRQIDRAVRDARATVDGPDKTITAIARGLLVEDGFLVGGEETRFLLKQIVKGSSTNG